MCGFTGFYLNSAIENRALEETVTKMATALEHRGPDDSGIWVDQNKGLALGHRRLSVVDTSSFGHQPMTSQNKRYVIAFNGEIYNHIQLREELNLLNTNLRWNGHSDTETLLAGFELLGIDKTLNKLIGMFAISLWDCATNTIHLIRDRFGEKPLYYGWIKTNTGSVFAFGSELKALREYPGFNNCISRSALKQYFKYMYVPAPYSIYDGIYKLEPGSMISVTSPPKNAPKYPLHHSNNKDIFHENLKISKWYDLKEKVIKNSENLISNREDASSVLESQLEETIKLQSLADVPLGAFLSGGVDSSAIVAIMQNQSSTPIKTFTIGFDEAEFDESTFAKNVASHLKTDHHEMRVTSEDAMSLIPKLPHLYDEPFADSSQIPTFFVSQAAKKEVTVSLSGDAGDELFGGYNRYFLAPQLWNKINWMPYSARKMLGKTLINIPLNFWDKVGDSYNLMRHKSRGISRFGDKVHKTAYRLCQVDSLDALYKSLVTEWPNTDALVKSNKYDFNDSSSLINSIDDLIPANGLEDSVSRMMYWDMISYLPDDILCKVDRAAMGNSLETRVPFLDHRIVELSFRIPLNLKINGNIGKSVLRDILYKHVPKDLIERPKAGFGIPLGAWLRGPLKPWVEELIDSDRLKKEGYLEPEIITKIWNEHLNYTRDWSFRIWSVVIFQEWLESLS
jgi:asparagine synthase (glutamine-hydrolysing)